MLPEELNPGEEGVKWRARGLFSCASDCALCFKTCFLPCITFGETREMLYGGELPADQWSPAFKCLAVCLVTCGICTWAYTMRTRTDIRKKYNLKPQPCNDCCVHFWCLPFALCQERRELQLRPLTPWIAS